MPCLGRFADLVFKMVCIKYHNLIQVASKIIFLLVLLDQSTKIWPDVCAFLGVKSILKILLRVKELTFCNSAVTY